LEEKSKNMTFSVVLRNKAANELAQLKGKDPLPVRAKRCLFGAVWCVVCGGV
jgi:hypothetical protein